MTIALSVIGTLSRGLIAASDVYGRGIDMRFKIDSFVLISFMPKRLAYVHQMMGRSSRTMGKNYCKLVCVDKILTNDRVEDRIRALNFVFLKDGLKIAKIMRGRRRKGLSDDALLMKAFKQGWRMNLSKIKKLFKPKDLILYERAGGIKPAQGL